MSRGIAQPGPLRVRVAGFCLVFSHFPGHRDTIWTHPNSYRHVWQADTELIRCLPPTPTAIMGGRHSQR